LEDQGSYPAKRTAISDHCLMMRLHSVAGAGRWAVKKNHPMPSSQKAIAEERLRQDAWLGDAVLELYVREWILRRENRVDAEMKRRFTCNEFLNCLGVPTRVEARIGVVYREQGLQAAFDCVGRELEPLFLKQEANRKR
jgi:dsRNA-specific ribonuclease